MRKAIFRQVSIFPKKKYTKAQEDTMTANGFRSLKYVSELASKSIDKSQFKQFIEMMLGDKFEVEIQIITIKQKHL